MDEPYKYRNRPLNQQAMQELILKLYEGKTRTRAEIIEGLEREHRRLGGTATKDLSNRGRLTGAFKGAAAGLRKRGAMKDAGYKYWHVIGNPSTPTPGQLSGANSLSGVVARELSGLMGTEEVPHDQDTVATGATIVSYFPERTSETVLSEFP